MKESLNDKEQKQHHHQQQEGKSTFLPSSTSAFTSTKDLFNDQNYLDLIQNLTRNHDFDKSTVNPSLASCNQPYTASSINSILSSFKLPTPNPHSPLPLNIWCTPRPLNHLLDHEQHLSGALISPSLSPLLLPPPSSSSGSSSSSCPSPSLQKYLKYIRSISTNTCHNSTSTVSAYPSPSSCTSISKLSSPFIHNSSNMFAQFSENSSPTEDIVYSKMNNQGKNTLPVLARPLQQQQVQQDEAKSVQLMCNYNFPTSLTRHPSLSSINTTPKSRENNYLAEDEYPIGEQHPCYPFVIASTASPTKNNHDDNKNVNTAQNILQLSSVNTDEYQLKKQKSSSRNTSNSNKKASKLLLSKRINSDVGKIKSNNNNNNNCMLTKVSNKHKTDSNNNNNNSTDGNGSSASTSSQHNKNSNGSHVCTVCSRQFSRSDMLVRHAHVHTGHRPFECTICGQAFSRSDHLSTHQRTHTGQRPYQCSLCYYSASRRDMITRHLRVHQRRGHIIPTSEGQGSTKVQFTTKTSQSL
ncbi:unnamed protein product [Trichobilharzia szidati]|nr:unnamed protein product [Trichobilharzia szidati]